jgi:hypothetical protein
MEKSTKFNNSDDSDINSDSDDDIDMVSDPKYEIDDFVRDFNKIFTNGYSYDKSYNEYPNNIFFDIKLFKLMNSTQCIHCKNNYYPVRLFGHCIKHFNLLNLIQLGNDAKSQMDLILNKIDKCNLYLSLFTSILKLKNDKYLIKTICKKNEMLYKKDNTICTKLMEKFGKLNQKFIKNNDILYDDLMKEYNKHEYLEVDNLDRIDAENVKYNDNILMVLKSKQLRTEYSFLKQFFINKKVTDCHFDNSEYIYYKILENNNLSACISNLELEKTFKIIDCSGKEHAYRVDLYLQLKTFHKTLYKNFKSERMNIIIEIDESHHLTNTKCIINDINKDMYFIKNGFSIIRVDISRRKINDDDIKEVIRHLVEIQQSRKLRYVFSKAYIKSHDINNKFTHKKVSKGIHITREMLGEI